MPALFLAQEQLGWIDEDAIDWVSSRLDVHPAHVKGAASFYTMYYKNRPGRYHLQVCRTLSCKLGGAGTITEFLKQRLGVGPKEVTADGMWSYEEVECLGSCGTGPVVQINDVYFEKLDLERLEQLLKRIEAEQPDLRYSTLRGDLGEGLPDLPRSQVWGKTPQHME